MEAACGDRVECGSATKEAKLTELFYSKDQASQDGVLTLSGPEAHHIARVLRHRPGDRIYATDGLGAEYDLELVEVGPQKVVGAVRGTRDRPREPRCRLVLAQGVIRGERLARVVDGATQLGVSEIVPLVSRRTTAGLHDPKLARLRKVASAAMKCSTRTVLPVVREVTPLEVLVSEVSGYDAAVVAYEGECSRTLGDALSANARSVLVVVGPEGGFESDEVRALESAGAVSFTMGRLRLRSEVAAVVAVALALEITGQMRLQRATLERRCD